MELLSSSKFLIPPPQNTVCPATYWMKTLRSRPTTFANTFPYYRPVIRSKKSSYQDFQAYAKPSKLLPATEVTISTDASVAKAVDFFPSGRSKSLYKVELQTSKIYGSGLTDTNSGILLCLISENGSSILQRLTAILAESDSRSEDKAMYDTVHFQRGSADEFAFEGPNLGRIAAVWIGLESGQWRIAGLNVTLIDESPPSPAEENPETKQLVGLQYNFEFEDVLLGDSLDCSMMEFRPQSVTAFSGDVSSLFDQDRKSINSSLTSTEESMKEYTDLKFSLLFYDSVLVLVGSLIASFSTDENGTYAFITGGLFGFIYLVLLQRSVDGLEAPQLVPSESRGGFGEIFGKLGGPIFTLAVAFAFAIVTVKYASGEDSLKLTANELILGVMGFLMCKVSVVLSAFKPFGVRNENQEV